MSLESPFEAESRLQRDPEDRQRRFNRWIQSARIYGRSLWIELFRDREDWNAAPEEIQDEAIQAAADRLGPQFTLLGTKIYECEDQRHRIAQFEHKPTGCRLNLIPGGSFVMGGRLPDETPLHRVSLGPMLTGETAVTQSHWDKIGEADQRQFRGPERPIEGVSWNAIQLWLRKAGDALRLPTEAEWEYACRAGSQGEYCFGDDLSKLGDYAWHSENSRGMSQDVRRLKPNAFGLYDVHGNVWEWCQDSWHNYVNTSTPTAGLATSGPRFELRIYRGGSWRGLPVHCRAANRSLSRESTRDPRVGFRICRSLD